MNNNGFYIKKIVVMGVHVENATIKFNEGLNVLSGASDTGKSYIFECINYMLGAKDKPKKIEEAKGYNSVLMEIELYNGQNYTIKRFFNKTEIEVYPTVIEQINNGEPKKLKANHKKDETDNISAFYLEKSGYITPIYVKKNKVEETRTLSFRDLSLYISINEEKVIKTVSPIFSGNYTSETVEKSIFKYIISGIDDTDNSQDEDKNTISPTKLKGQKELLDKLILKEENKLTSPEYEQLYSREYFSEKMNILHEQLENISYEIKEETENRRLLWIKIEKDKSKNITDNELLKRLLLLKEYYESDLERLSFITEANYYFEQLNFSLCPYCKQQLQEKNTSHRCGFNNQFDNMFVSVEAEREKINSKLADLNSTIAQIEIEQRSLTQKIKQQMREYLNLEKRINSILQPQEIHLKTLINSYINDREITIEYRLINSKLQDLIKEKETINELIDNRNSTKVLTKDSTSQIQNAIKDFCNYFSNTLTRWKLFPALDINYENGQFYINSELVGNFGKGYRAIIQSAFTISVMEYCKEKDMPHPGFVLLDSPLTTYQGEKSENDEVNEDVQDAFFKDLSNLNDNMQVIIIDNKEPEATIKEKINFEEFTRDKMKGRYGFF